MSRSLSSLDLFLNVQPSTGNTLSHHKCCNVYHLCLSETIMPETNNWSHPIKQHRPAWVRLEVQSTY